MSDNDWLNSPRRKDIEAAILARLEAKSDHRYQWPRWAAAEEASYAVMELEADYQRTAAASVQDWANALRKIAEAGPAMARHDLAPRIATIQAPPRRHCWLRLRAHTPGAPERMGRNIWTRCGECGRRYLWRSEGLGPTS